MSSSLRYIIIHGGNLIGEINYKLEFILPIGRGADNPDHLEQTFPSAVLKQ